MRNVLRIIIPAILFTLRVPAQAQSLSGPALTHALQSGGYVIVLRHASSPQTPPAKDAAEPDNTRDERQLDTAGKAAAESMGEALRRLQIPIGEVFSSPAYRALETVKYAQLGTAKPVPELGDHGMSMSTSFDEQAKWLQEQVTHVPPHGNTFLITHAPNLTAAFPHDATEVKDGEALVFHPDGKGSGPLVARIPMDGWQRLQP